MCFWQGLPSDESAVSWKCTWKVLSAMALLRVDRAPCLEPTLSLPIISFTFKVLVWLQQGALDPGPCCEAWGCSMIQTAQVVGEIFNTPGSCTCSVTLKLQVCNSCTGKRREANPWGSVTRQPSLLSKFPARERPCLKKTTVEEQHQKLSSGVHSHAHIHTCQHTHTHMHAHTCIYIYIHMKN